MTERRLTLEERHQMKVRLLRRSGNRCEGCGFQFQGHPQALARNQGAAELDHKIPDKRHEHGGADRIDNLQVLCLPCHDGKTNEEGQTGPIRNMTDAEWRAAGKPKDWRRRKRLTRRRQRTR